MARSRLPAVPSLGVCPVLLNLAPGSFVNFQGVSHGMVMPMMGFWRHDYTYLGNVCIALCNVCMNIICSFGLSLPACPALPIFSDRFSAEPRLEQ